MICQCPNIPSICIIHISDPNGVREKGRMFPHQTFTYHTSDLRPFLYFARLFKGLGPDLSLYCFCRFVACRYGVDVSEESPANTQPLSSCSHEMVLGWKQCLPELLCSLCGEIKHDPRPLSDMRLDIIKQLNGIISVLYYDIEATFQTEWSSHHPHITCA